MADIVLGFALDKISTFLIEQGRLLGGLRQEIQLIGDEFGHMKAFLENMADVNQENDDPQLTEWIRQVREVSYETEDILDEFLFLSAGNHLPGFRSAILSSFDSTKNLPARHRLATKLQIVKTRIVNISEARRRYESRYSDILPRINAGKNTWRHSKDDDALLVGESDLVGIDEPRKHLLSQLLDDDGSQLKAIAILGMGGLGKTTLAKKVYEDAAVKNHFQIRVWITVSQNCDFQNVLKDLIQQLVAQFSEPAPPCLNSMNIYNMKAFLKEFLVRGRYLVVFDDVWDTEFWDAFKFALPDDGYIGNRVIFTTRITNIASQGYAYRMESLNFQDSWTLLCKKVFKDRLCPNHLTNVARSIVAKCKGLPLAILSIGGLLASKDSSRTKDWEMVLTRLGDELEATGKFDGVKRILSLSYNDLPSKLKACLLYTSIWTPGYNISSHRLIQLLVAEGFVEQKEGQTVEESAWDCLRELANRSLIQLNQVLYNGMFDWIFIHDLWREFIASKSREQNTVTIIRTGWHSETMVRRLVFHHNLLEIPIPERSSCMNNCRSIVNFGGKKSVSKAVLAKLLSCNLLTTLDLRGFQLEEIPGEVFKLFQLRFLGMSGKRIKTVSKSIKRLRNLQCLVLEDTSVKDLPMEIQKLHKLRHLRLAERVADSPIGHLIFNGFKPPSGMGGLLELQTLRVIDVRETEKTRIVSEIAKLTKLTMLWITNLRREHGKELCSSLKNLNNLQELVVASLVEKDEVMSLDLDHLSPSASCLKSLHWLQLFGRLEKMPTWIRNLDQLERVTLSLSNLADDPLKTLQHLPNLFEIWLTEAYEGEVLCFEAWRFLKLKKLVMKNMKWLKSIRVEKGALPVINELIMQELPSVEELPLGIEHLSQLEKLELWNMNSRFINNLENSGNSEEESDDYEKISRVSQVIIGFRSNGRWNSHRLSRNKNVK